MRDKSEKRESVESYIKRTKGNFKLALLSELPSNRFFDESDQSHQKALKRIQELNQERIQVYAEYVGTSEFRSRMGMVTGKMSGVIRNQRAYFIMYTLKELQRNSPESFEKFTLTAWRELSLHLFEIAPAKSTLLELLSDKDRNTGKRLTPSGWYPDAAVELLLEDHQEMVEKINNHFKAYIKKLDADSKPSIKGAEAAIKKIKEAHAEA